MSDTERSILIGIAVVLAILFLLPAFLMGGMFPLGGMMGGGMMGGWPGSGARGFGLGWLWPMVFWGGIITAIVLLVRSASRARPGTSAPGGETALDILKKRYARGEITQAEFEERKRVLDLE